MRLRTLRLALAYATLGLAGQLQAADLLVHNINGYTFTQSSNEPLRFDQLLIRDGKVLSTDNDQIARQINEQTPRLDGKGRFLLPGLIDAHGHLANLGLSLASADLRNNRSASEAVAQLAEFVGANKDQDWYYGRGWNQENWPDRQFPTATLLDRLAIQRPVVLERIDGHALWVNRAALALAGIDDQTPDPDGGKIVRDTAGKATGILVDNAMGLLLDKLPAVTRQEQSRRMDLAFTHLLAQGLTGIHDAGIDQTTQDLLRNKAHFGKLPLRVYAMLDGASPSLHKWLDGGWVKNDFLHIRSVKLYADGALGSRGATLLTDYQDAPGQRGLAVTDPDKLAELFYFIDRHGYQVAVHAIGDRANRDVLDGFEKAYAKGARRLLRHRIEHAQVIDPADLARLQPLGLIASMQPSHATSDMHMAERRLGQARLAGAYAWRSLLDKGTRLAFGSDFVVESANPFYGIHAAVTRQDHQSQPDGGWRPQEKLSVAEAIRLFTRDAAYAGHWETEVGSLEPGKWADFILLDTNPFTTLPGYLWQIKVEQTWVGGKKRWPVDD